MVDNYPYPLRIGVMMRGTRMHLSGGSMEDSMIKRIHVNQHNIKWNAKHPKDDERPVMTVKTYKKNYKADRVRILGESEVLYSPNKPLSCGAKVWIETHSPVFIGTGSEGSWIG